MNRLTKRAKNGLAYSDIPLNQSSVLDVNENIVECYTGFIAERLAAYEDTGLEPEEMKKGYEAMKNAYDVCIEREELHAEIQEQIREYRKLEEQGLLIKLPCKVRDTVYVDAMTFGTRDDIEYAEAEVVSIRITKKQTFLKLRIFALGLDGMPYGCKNYSVSSFGKTVFLTREEAEKALEEATDE